MKLKFNFASHGEKFLEVFEPIITFDTTLIVAEEENNVMHWLADNGLLIEDVEASSLKFNNKNLITLPSGTRVEVLGIGEDGLVLTTLDGDDSIVFEQFITYGAYKDSCIIDCTALDDRREQVFKKFGTTSPSEDDETIFFNFYLADLVDAVDYLGYNGENRSCAFEDCKTMDEQDVRTKIQRYAFRLINDRNLDIDLEERDIDIDTIRKLKSMRAGWE